MKLRSMFLSSTTQKLLFPRSNISANPQPVQRYALLIMEVTEGTQILRNLGHQERHVRVVAIGLSFHKGLKKIAHRV